MKVNVRALLEVEIDDYQLSRTLMHRAAYLCGNPDDPGVDWYTDDQGNTYLAGDPEWFVSSSRTVALMVDLAHALDGCAPREFKMPPGEPTVTTAMKGACMGKFSFKRETACPVCSHDGDPCDVCGGAGHYAETIDVPWTTCKHIYKAMTKAAGR